LHFFIDTIWLFTGQFSFFEDTCCGSGDCGCDLGVLDDFRDLISFGDIISCCSFSDCKFGDFI